MKKIEWHIIRKVMDGTATAGEKSDYEQWLEASEEHRAYMEKLKLYDGKAGSLSEETVSAYYRKLSEILCRRKRFRRLMVWGAVAAVLLMGLGIGLSLMRMKTFRFTDVSSVFEVKRPHVVTLTMPDGCIYDIEKGDTNVVPLGKMDLSDSFSSGMKTMRILEVPYGKTWKLQLADGSCVQVNANSRLLFPETFDGQSERRVAIAYGEAYFEVAPDSTKPFIVSTGDVETRVYGTKFNINAYSPVRPKTTLVTGKVSVVRPGMEKEMVLRPGEQCRWDEEGKIVVEKVDIPMVIAWVNDVFFFRNTSLDEITDRLADWYGVEFLFTKEKLKKERFYCRLPRTSSLDVVLKALERSERIRFNREGDRVTVY